MNTFAKVASVLLMAISLLGAQIAQAQAPVDRKPKPPAPIVLTDYMPGISFELAGDKILVTYAVYASSSTGQSEKVDVAGYVYTDGSMDMPNKHTKATFETKVAFNGANGYYSFELDATKSVRVCEWIDKKGHLEEVIGGEANNLKCLILVLIRLDQSGSTRTASYLAYANEPKPSDIDHYYSGFAHWIPVVWTKDVTDLSALNVRSGEWLQMLPGSAGLWYSHEYLLVTTPDAEAAGWYTRYNRWYLR